MASEYDMRIGGYAVDQIGPLVDMWGLGSPVDVAAFMERTDIPCNAKCRVREAGKITGDSIEAQARAYQLMQAQILIEVAKLDQARWKP